MIMPTEPRRSWIDVERSWSKKASGYADMVRSAGPIQNRQLIMARPAML